MNAPRPAPNAAPTPTGRIGAAKQAFDWARELRGMYLERTRWTVTVDSSDPLFDAAHRWFTDLADGEHPPRRLTARMRTSARSDAPVPEHHRDIPPEIETFYDERHERTAIVGGHQVRVNLERVDIGNARREGYAPSTPDTLRFHARDRHGQQAVLTALRELVETMNKRQPCLYLLNSWGGWARRDDLPPRPLDTVVLPDGQLERIAGDLERFLAAEADYVRRGMPWHRGYLLEGPPGTGKTSIVRALSAHYGLDLWYAPLGDIGKDANLLNAVAEVRPRSILLLEDVDVFHATRSRGDQGEGVTMAGVLNALDGVATPHGLVTVLTSNTPDVLDAALLRPGRVDLREHIGTATSSQVKQLWAQWYGRKYPIGPGTEVYARDMTTADAVGIFQRFPDDPDAALEQLGWRATSS